MDRVWGWNGTAGDELGSVALAELVFTVEVNVHVRRSEEVMPQSKHCVVAAIPSAPGSKLWLQVPETCCLCPRAEARAAVSWCVGMSTWKVIQAVW